MPTSSGTRQVHTPTLQAALSPPAPTSTLLPGRKLFVDLFAGASAPLSTAVAALNLARLEPLEKLHGCAFDLLDEKHYHRLGSLASSGIVGAASSFSRARLRPGGPKPVRTPEFPTGIPSPSAAQQAELDLSAQLLERTRHFLSLVSAHGGLIILENPSSSILWLDPAVRSWLAVHAPYCVHVAACQYGLPLPKAWAFWSNFSVLSSVACKCSHPPGFHPSFAGRRSPDGSFATRQTACYPDKLAAAIAAAIAPFLSVRTSMVAFEDWSSLLPTEFIWPMQPGRIEDGAGTCSSAFWGTPRELDILKPLRSSWLRRLQSPGLLSGILAHLVSPSKEPPLSDAALAPFLADLRSFLCVRDDATWAKLLYVDPGQPFRLNLWHCLSVLAKDPDMDFFRLLHAGVPLGIGDPIPPCKVLFPTVPLPRCDSSWKSALDHAALVDDLLATEIQEGWIRPVPGGDAALRAHGCRKTRRSGFPRPSAAFGGRQFYQRGHL